MTKVYSGIPPLPPPHFRKLQIWDDQSLLRNTPLPPISENFRFGMTKVYSGIPPPISENFRFGMTKVYSGIPPTISENFRFGMTKVYSGIPPHFGKLQIWDDQSLLRNTPPAPSPQENCQRVQVRDFLNTEIYYMWRLYPARITTSFFLFLGNESKNIVHRFQKRHEGNLDDGLK